MMNGWGGDHMGASGWIGMAFMIVFWISSHDLGPTTGGRPCHPIGGSRELREPGKGNLTRSAYWRNATPGAKSIKRSSRDAGPTSSPSEIGGVLDSVGGL
jgi:hypothetical protein